MRDQGVQATCWYNGWSCPKCGGPIATNGDNNWCAQCPEPTA